MANELLTYLLRFPDLNEEERQVLAQRIPVSSYPKGTVLLREGDPYTTCYFVLKGCIRQYSMVNGEEKTTGFYTEEQTVISVSHYMTQAPSDHYLACVEDAVLIVGTVGDEQEMYNEFPKLEAITRVMMEQDYGKTQEALTMFILSSPEERYLALMKSRPDLLQRVPQHQLASYLGVTPESLSRIRKRLVQKSK